MTTGNCDARLTECFSEAGKRWGFCNVKAGYLEYSNFKVTWQRGYKWIDFKVTDYLMDAPDGVLICLAESIYRRILGEEKGNVSELSDWITSPDFCKAKRETYLERNVFLTRRPNGKCRNLAESYNRLVGAGLVSFDPAIKLCWNRNLSRKAGNCSVLMKVVSISDALDTDETPDYVLDYCLYYELCNFMVEFKPADNVPDDVFYGYENRFPSKNQAKIWLRRRSMYI